MEFSNLGSHCSIPNCFQQDFLPFRCDACEQTYCRTHRSYFEHKCSQVPMGEEVCRCPICNKGITLVPGQDPNLTISQHMDSPNCRVEQSLKCPRCNVKLTGINSVMCNRCKQKLCLTHRYSDQHECTHPLERKINTMGYKCPKCTSTFPKSTDLIQHIRGQHSN